MDSPLGLILIGLAIFFARIVDVSLGTLRIISIVQGRTWLAFWVGFFEIIIWITVISAVVHFIGERPVLGIFYAFGFATGSMVGIKMERKIAFGHIILRVFSRENYRKMAQVLREAGYAVTTFQGEGLHGPVVELCIVCRRRDQRTILGIILEIEPTAFYMAEQTGLVSKIFRPVQQPATGWRALLKKK
ncbi:MAG: DUF5698 domain-containing protein [Desulfobulbaceae bacterium]|nr:DUF5698 domain-containing protein [Desulfobulbaceae bacterium]